MKTNIVDSAISAYHHGEPGEASPEKGDLSEQVELELSLPPGGQFPWMTDDLKQTGIHEAGHAVAFIRLGERFLLTLGPSASERLGRSVRTAQRLTQW